MHSKFFTQEGHANVINMPAGAPFLELLAKGLREALGDKLSEALILLPTRRAVRELGDAFIKTAAKDDLAQAALLPMMRPLADVEPDEPPFEPGDLAHQITPSIDPVRRKFELSNLVLEKEKRLRNLAPDAASALALTEPLLRLLDDSFMEELTLDDLGKLDEIIELSAKHYEHAAIFFKIISEYWPEHLAAHNVMDPMQRRVALLKALTDLWQQTPPDHHVIIAGSTGTLKATAELISVVSRLEHGAVILPGLDMNIDDATVWDKIGFEHPQGALKNLLEIIQIDRKDVRNFPDYHQSQKALARSRLIAEALIPADQTADWLGRVARIRAGNDMYDPIAQGLEGLSLIEANSGDEEAAAIALIMRETLETEGKTAALITPDPQLGRRVKAKLTRWDVTIDVSAGQPLEETPTGAYLSLILTLAQDPWDPVAMAGLFKHPLTAMGRKPREVTALWQQIEKAGFRGPRPTSFEKLAQAYGVKRGDFKDHFALIAQLHEALKPLSSQEEALSAKDFAELHCEIAQTLATRSDREGAERLWRNEDGEAAAKLMTDLMTHGDILQAVDRSGYERLLSNLMRGRVVRPKYGSEPRLSILGPLEARMLQADTIILGGLNEGIWPAPPSVDPVLSYGMRQHINLSSPERRFGLSAHDFAQLAANNHVIMTRTQKSDDGPTVASRWIWRLKTLLRGALGEEDAQSSLTPNTPYLDMAQALDRVAASEVVPAQRPEPRPPLSRRWPIDKNGQPDRRVSVTQVETWSRDPYAIYARKVLGLNVLDPLDSELGPREYGQAVHEALEHFVAEHKREIPSRAAQGLEQGLREALMKAGYSASDLAREGSRLKRMAQWFSDWERRRREEGWLPIALERKARLTLHPDNGQPFYLTGEIDRIDRKSPDGLHAEGQFSLLDYKTGSAPTSKQVNLGFNSQLPLEAVMLETHSIAPSESGAQLPLGEITELLYVKVSGGKNLGEQSLAGGKEADPHELSRKAYEGLLSLIDKFDDPSTAYLSQPRAQYENQNKYGDFDQLARRAEWAAAADEKTNGSREG